MWQDPEGLAEDFVRARTSAVTQWASKEPQQRNTMDWTDGPKQTAAGLMLSKAVYLIPDASKCGGGHIVMIILE